MTRRALAPLASHPGAAGANGEEAPNLTNLGGVAPIIIYLGDSGTVETISGLGCWPQAASREFFQHQQGGRMRRGIHRGVLPAAVDVWLTALQRHGTMPFAEVEAPAIVLADEGFPLHDLMQDPLSTASALEALRQWPTTSAVFLSRGQLPPLGARVVQKDLAGTLRRLVQAKREATSRAAGIEVARDRLYRGDLAEQIVPFSCTQGGWLTMHDLAAFRVAVEAPVKTTSRGYEVYACGLWCQGPMVPQTLNILDGAADPRRLYANEPPAAHHHNPKMEAQSCQSEAMTGSL